MPRSSRIVAPLRISCILLLGVAAESRAQFSGFWLDVGEYHNVYAESGARHEAAPGIPEGMNWPGILRESGHGWARAFWVGVKDWTDESGDVHPYYVARVGPRHAGEDVSSPVSTRIIARYEDTRVFVDGRHVDDKGAVVDEVDPALPADRMIVNTFNMNVGVTVTRTIYAYVNQFHDDYHLLEYEYCNSGNTDGDDDVELPDQTLHDTYFFHIHQWRGSGQGAWSGSSQQPWGRFNMMDVVGDGHASYPVDLTAFYVWVGWDVSVGEYNSLAAPLWTVTQDRHAPFDTVGRLAGASWMGRAFLHVDQSADDETFVRCTPETFDTCQPHTLGIVDTDSETVRLDQSHEHYYEVGILTPERPSRMFPHYADRVEPSGAFWAPTKDASSGGGLSCCGGKAPTEAIGPYTLSPGDCVYQAVVEGVTGLSYDAGVQIGRAYKRANADDAVSISYDATGDGIIAEKPFDYDAIGLPQYQGSSCTTCADRGSERLTKNEWFFTIRDSLFQMLFRARDAYAASRRMSVYPIAEAPYAPVELSIESGPTAIRLEWTPHPAGGPSIDRWEIYRTTASADNLLDAAGDGLQTTSQPWGEQLLTGYEKIAELPPSTTSYDDDDTRRAKDYFYYVVAVGLPQPDDPSAIAGTPGGAPLTSSRYLTQSYAPAQIAVSREDALELPEKLVINAIYPNPFTSSTTIHLTVPRPGSYLVSVYDDLGRRVHERRFLMSTTGPTSLPLDLRRLASGGYVVHVMETRTGTSATGRAVLVK